MATKTAEPKTETAPPRARAPRIQREPEEEFASRMEERAFMRQLERDQRELDEAWSKYPPGTKLYVTTARGIKFRNRSGLAFTSEGRAEVEVVDVPEAELAARVASGAYVVSPLGAKRIADDTGEVGGLIVFTAPEAPADSASDDELAAARADLAAARAEIARLKRGAEGHVSTGARERTGTLPPAGASVTPSADFGGDPKKG